VRFSLLVLCGLLVAANAVAAPLFPRPFEEIPAPPQDLRGVAVADFNNDGQLDLAAAAFRFNGSEHSGFVHVYLGNGDGGFTTLEPFDSDDAPGDGEFSEPDGRLDLPGKR